MALLLRPHDKKCKATPEIKKDRKLPFLLNTFLFIISNWMPKVAYIQLE